MTTSKGVHILSGAHPLALLAALLMTVAVLVGCASPAATPRGDTTHAASSMSGAGNQGALSEPGPQRRMNEPTSGVPTRIRIPALDIDAPVLIATESDGALGIPEDITAVGWDNLTVEAGARHGTTLIAGHRDDAIGALGALGALDQAQPGNVVLITTRHGVLRYKITRVETYSKTDLPPSIVATTERHRLALVTCGGSLVAGTDGALHWAHNVVVWAIPKTSR